MLGSHQRVQVVVSQYKFLGSLVFIGNGFGF
jgi:hypothetical protein